MFAHGRLLRSVFFRKISLIVMMSMGLALTAAAAARHPPDRTLQGSVRSNGVGLAHYRVSLYASFVRHGSSWVFLGSDSSDDSGNFRIVYSLPRGLADQQPLLFVEARRGPAMLASAIGSGGNAPRYVVVNERTTVATGNAFAQFVHGQKIEGNTYGMMNAVHMAANLANPRTGGVGIVLSSTPNGSETSTFETFNSLTNVVASCVADARNCRKLFKATTPPGGARPANLLQAVANLVKYPSYPGYPSNADDPVFLLSQLNPVYQPALTQRPTSWLLFLKFTGGFYSAQNRRNLMDGPGNIALDKRGFAWVNDNYVPQPPDHFACAGRRLMKFYPWGKNYPGSPYFGGGLSGAGYGISLDPYGRVWVGNFGFQDPPCALLSQAATNNSVSVFHPDGSPISRSKGYTKGNISWPQGTVSDRHGNIWIANCGNDSVTELMGGNPHRAINIKLGPVPPANNPQMKPFGVSIDRRGNVWVNGNRSNTVWVISARTHKVIATLHGTYHGKTVLSHPVGNAADSKGNIWVANSDWLDAPCPTRTDLGAAANPSVTMFQMKTRKPYPGSPFTGGGLTLPWGIAVDGDNTVWVFNFGVIPPGRQTTDIPTGISRFCGIDVRKCPAGLHVGDPISPSTGYRSNALERITGGQIDPSGNIWLVNNWKRDANPFQNPGGNAIVIVVGAAGPLKTPLIGPPVPFKSKFSRHSHERFSHKKERRE